MLFWILLSTCAREIYAQVFVELSVPQTIEQCLGLPVQVRISNEGKMPLRDADIQLLISNHFQYRGNSLSGNNIEVLNASDPAGPLFRLRFLDVCESTSFQFWMDHNCAAQGHQDSLHLMFSLPGTKIQTKNQYIQVYSPQVSILNLGLFFDENDQVFKKKFTIVNIGQVAMDAFLLFIDGDDKMQIINTNLGQLSSNGDTLYFNPADFSQTGNYNGYFERGETLTLIQDIKVDPCETEFKISHKLLVPCGKQQCEFAIQENVKLLAIVGKPNLVVTQDTQIYASPCRDGEVHLNIKNQGDTSKFDLGNSMYNLVLNLGWALIRNGQFTDPLQDNCLKLTSVSITGKKIPIVTSGFTGYGIDFRKLNMDPDGPGGLDDLDGDGFYDDLLPGDSIQLKIIYEMDPNCIRPGCDIEVFERRILRLNAKFNNYCGVEGTYDNYLSNHSYYWSRPSVSTLRYKSIYVDKQRDTVQFYLQKNLYHFLEDCDTDSIVVRINLPTAAEFLTGSVILVNNKPVSYKKNGNVITFSSDTSNFIVSIPLVFHCDPASGSGGVNTACTFCLGSGGPRFSIGIDADYYCNSCYSKIPLYCGSTPAFPVVCDTSVVGVNSPAKLVIGDVKLKRLTLGYRDSTQSSHVNPDIDSLSHNYFLPYDTFLMQVPFDVLCDANFSNIVFKLAIAPRYYYINGVLDTIKEVDWLADTLRYFDRETNRWSTCVGALGPEIFSQNTNNWYHYYLREMDLSSMFGGCLRGSLSKPDSMLLTLKGVIRNFELYQWDKATVYTDLNFSQDGCAMQSRKATTLNILSGKPAAGSAYLRQAYFSDPNYKQSSAFLSVCGTFRLETAVDAYGSYADASDPFPNEFRNAYVADQIKMVIPPFFSFKNNNPNYTRISRIPPTGNLKYDTAYIQPTITDSAGYTLLLFDKFNDHQDHQIVQHQFWFDLEPDCYNNASDTIRIFKKFRYHLHHPDSSFHKYFETESKYAVNTSTAELFFPDVRKQILKDTLVVWPFSLNSKNEKSAPAKYFTYKHNWLLVENLSGQVFIDSLVEYDSLGNSQKHAAISIDPQHIVFELDSLYGRRDFKFFTHFNDCHSDSLVIFSGNSCSAYPSDYLNISGTCKDYRQRKVLYYDPEDSRIRLEILTQPMDSLAQPCDTFSYSVLVYNSGLGHSFNNSLHFIQPSGLNLLSAVLEYPKDSFHVLPIPFPGTSGQEYYWKLESLLLPQGFPGFYRVDENQYWIHLKFAGDCRLEDGQSLSFYTQSSNVCNEIRRSEVVSSTPFSFSKQSQPEQNLYDLRLSFNADSACGEKFSAKVILISRDSMVNQQEQKLYFIYAKELRFIPGSFKAGKHVRVSAAGFYLLDGMESVEVPLDGHIAKGDSVVFELELERTCIELCKTTDFKIILNSPQPVSCAQAGGGQCEQLLKVQQWKFENISVSPHILILDSDVRSQFLPGGDEWLDLRYLLSNRSPFTGKTDYAVNLYYDQNANNRLDTGDVLISAHQVKGDAVPGLDSIWVPWSFRIPGKYTCHLIMEINPVENPCLCNGDTLIIRSPVISGESQIHRICYDQKIRIGFDSIPLYAYEWSKKDRVDQLSRSYTTYQYPDTLIPGQSLWDTLLVDVQKNKGCAFKDTVFIQLFRLDANLLLLDSILCHGDHDAVIEANGIGAANRWTYHWTGRPDTTARLSGLGPGTYVVELEDTYGCKSMDSLTLSEPTPLRSSLAITSDYNGFPVSCYGAHDGSVQVQISGGTPMYHYNWTNGSTGDKAEALGSGWIELIVYDAHGCPLSDSIFLTQPPPLQLSGESSPAGCDNEHGGAAIVSVKGGVLPYAFSWSNGQKSDTIRNVPSGNYMVHILDANQCPADTVLYVDQRPDPDISLNITDTTIVYGNSIRLSAWSNAYLPKYKWSPSQLVSCDTCAAVFVSPRDQTYFEVEVRDAYGCTNHAAILVSVRIVKDVWAPNVFSPNGDGVNDKFTIYGTPSLLEIVSLQIFDRWGELLYEAQHFPPNNPSYGWDGIFKGEPMNPAVFAYLAWVRFADGEIRKLYGDVTLLK